MRKQKENILGAKREWRKSGTPHLINYLKSRVLAIVFGGFCLDRKKKTDGRKHRVLLQQKFIFHVVQRIFLKFSQSFKTERLYRQSVSLKKKPKGLATFLLDHEGWR